MCDNLFLKSLLLRSRAEEVSKDADEGQQYPVEDAYHVRSGGRPEENVRTTVIHIESFDFVEIIILLL